MYKKRPLVGAAFFLLRDLFKNKHYRCIYSWGVSSGWGQGEDECMSGLAQYGELLGRGGGDVFIHAARELCLFISSALSLVGGIADVHALPVDALGFR